MARIFTNLLNGSDGVNVIGIDDNYDHNTTYIRRMNFAEVKEALNKMKTSKTHGLDEIPIEVCHKI